MEHENGNARFAVLEERFAGYEVRDDAGEEIGEIDLIFADENGRPEYFGVKTGFPGAGSPLIPMESVWVDEERRVIEIPLPKDRVGEGPSYHDDRKITPDFERRVRLYYGLRDAQEDPARLGADGEPPSRSFESTERSTTVGEREAAVFHQKHITGAADEKGVGGNESGRGNTLGDTDELRVQRSEEEARVGTRGREAGVVKVRKSVRTEREQVRLPKRREEVDIERVPGKGRDASGLEIGEDDEVVVQVLEEEIVVSKRVVVKEEIRLRKKVVEDEEVVEVDLRKEEVDIEDTTRRGDAGGGTDLEDETGRRER